MIASIIYTVLIIGGLLYLIRKKSDNEPYFPLKIIGYYTLGIFSFNFNQIALPLGFIIYLLFFRPKLNVQIKRQAALFGLIVFVIVQWITPVSSYLWESRTINIEHELGSVYRMNFEEENELIMKELQLDDSSIKLQNFSVDYTKSGKIIDLRWELIQQDHFEFVYYDIHYEVSKKSYQVTHSNSESMEDFISLVDANYFFEKMNMLPIKDITNAKGDYSKYIINSFGNMSNYGVMDNDPHIITDGEIQSLTENQLPVYGYRISTYALKKMSEETDEQGNIIQEGWEGTATTDYLFDITAVEEEEEY